MKKQFLPKPLKQYKNKIYKNFTIIDFFILSFFSILTILFWVSLNLKFYYKIILATSILLFGFCLTIPGKYEIKIYEKIYYLLIYISSKKKYSKKESQLLFPFEKINKGIIKLKSGSYIKVVELNGFDFFLLKENDQKIRIKYFQDFLLKNNNNFKIYKTNMEINLNDQIQYVDKLNEKWKRNKKIHKISKLSKEILNNLISRNTHVQDRYFLFLYGTSHEDLNNKYNNTKTSLENASLNPIEILEDTQLIEVINSIYGVNNISMIKEKFKLDYKTTFHPKYIKSENKYLKILNVCSLPKEAYLGWIGSLSNIDGVDWMININEYPKDKAKKKLDRVIESLEIKINKKASEEAETNSYLDAMHELNKQINGNGETIKSINIFIIIKANTKKELDLKTKEIYIESISSGINLSKMNFLQKDIFKDMIPSLNKVSHLTRSVELQSLGLAYGFPFLNEDHKDKNGFYLGYSYSGRNIFFDPLLRDNKKRVNSNMYIFGTSGKGKSTTSKKIIKELFLAGHKIIAIDPEREYDILSENLNGTWLNFGTDRSLKDKNYVINPMQFLKNETDDRELLSSHMQFLEEFFKTLYPELNLREISILKKYILKSYLNKKITDENSYLNIPPSEFPIISDIYKLIIKDIKKEKDKIKKDILTHLSIYFDSFNDKRSPEHKLWNNHTNFDLYNSNFIVADLLSLSESGNKRIKNAQMFILLKMVNNFMVENKIKIDKGISNDFIVIVIDEAHLMVDSQAPFATKFMFEIVKRGRKYNAMTVITTQSVRDFLGKNKDLSDYTSGIINNCQYGFILGMRSGDITDLNNSMKASGGLTNYEMESLSMADQGKCLFIASTLDRKIMQIDIADEELKIWER